MANFLDLSSIATMGSAGFLIIFAAVNLANVRLRQETRSRGWLSASGFGVCLIALLALIWQTARTTPDKILILIVMVGVSAAIELIYRAFTGRHIRVV